MRALVLDADGPRLDAGCPRPVPGHGEVRVRPTRMGICATDLALIAGYAGFRGVLGHEFVGTVDAVGHNADASWVGRRVVASINVGCGRCQTCLGEGPEHCATRTVVGIRGRDGAFAEALVVPVANLFAVPDSVDEDEAVFTEPLAAAVRVREQVQPRVGDRVAVVGPGRLGLLIAQVLADAGARVAVLGRRASSLVLPRALGLDTGMAAEAPADAFGVVVEATGNDGGLAEAMRLVRPRGRLVLKSTYAGRAQVDLSKLVVGEVSVLGSRCGPFAPALRLLAQGRVQVRPLIDARYGLDQALDALAHAGRPGVRKVLLVP